MPWCHMKIQKKKLIKNQNQEQIQEQIQPQPQPQKPIILFDVDDVILSTSSAIIPLISPTASLSSLHDWGYKSIIRTLPKSSQPTQEHILSLFESPSFWSTVTLKPHILSIFTDPLITSTFSFLIASKGTPLNLELKSQFLSSHLPPTPFIPLSLSDSKSSITDPTSPLYHPVTIQIDDNYNFLDTTAPLKILLTNNLTTDYNYHNGKVQEDLYIVNNLSEVHSILTFFANNPELLPH